MTKTNAPEAKPAQVEAKAQPAQVIDLHRLISCLEEVEGGQWNWPGGKLSFKRDTWHEVSKASYIHACDPTKAREAAARLLSTADAFMLKHDLEPSVKLLALSWRHGLEGMLRHKDGKSDYADRVANLYFDPSFKEAL